MMIERDVVCVEHLIFIPKLSLFISSMLSLYVLCVMLYILLYFIMSRKRSMSRYTFTFILHLHLESFFTTIHPSLFIINRQHNKLQHHLITCLQHNIHLSLTIHAGLHPLPTLLNYINLTLIEFTYAPFP